MAHTRDPMTDRERIAATELWQPLDTDIIDALFESGETMALEAGKHLFRPGDTYHKRIYLHLEGELQQTSSNGDVRIAQPGDIIGLASYLDGDSYRSMAEAVSACRLLAVPATEVQRLEHESPGFFEAINRALAARMRKARQVRETVRGILARPVREFMRSAVATCTSDTTIAQAGRIMDERQIGSLGVVDGDDRLLGLITPMILLNALVENESTPDDPVHSATPQELTFVTQETPLWQVEQLQRRHRVHEIVVMDDNESPIGIISQTDLLQALARPPYTLDAEIHAASDIETLAELRERIPVAARRVHETHRNVGMAVRALTEMHLDLQHRLIELILEQMYREGLGRPPGRFAVIIMGSGGRGEMLLRPDQDNGMILDDNLDETGLKWFEDFAERLNPELDRIGYRLCPGDVMARNPEYRRTLSSWREKLSSLIRDPGRKEARLANIVLDFSTLYGSDSLTMQLRSHLNRELANDQGKMLFRRMVSDDADIAQPLGFFNRFITSSYKGSQVIDLKKTGLRIIVDSMRVFSLREGISRCKTLERIASLQRLGIFDTDFIDTMRIAFEELQDLLLTHQLGQIERGETPDPLIRMERLSSHDRERLRVSLRAAQRMREHCQYTFGMILHR